MNIATKIKREIAAMVAEETTGGRGYGTAKKLLTDALDEINLLRVEKDALTKEIGRLTWALNMVRSAIKRIDEDKK